MKKSYYNFLFQPKDGKNIVYNSRTGAMAELDEAHMEQLRDWTEQEIAEKNPAFAEALLQNGFAVVDGVSEQDMIQYDSFHARFGSRSLGLTITPTQDCNFRCQYCYEKDVIKPAYMNEETQEALIAYVKGNLVPEGIMTVCWYGGEPLMALPVISSLTQKMLAVCEEKHVEYKADIVTNGYLLTQETVQELVRCKIRQIQVTLDGSRETHNQRRPLAGGHPTYDAIWNNLLALKAYEKEILVDLRVNVDKSNYQALTDVSEEIRSNGMEHFVRVYPGKVVSDGGCYQQDVCFENREFALLEESFFKDNRKHLPSRYPKPRHNVCGADAANAVVIDAEGFIYKCWMDIGNRTLSVGNIKSGTWGNEALLYQYMLYEPVKDEACSRCKYLPVCLGGCPRERLQGKRGCTTLKETVQDYMEYLPEVMEQNRG